MSWFKLDDDGHDHPKVLQAGNEAYGAWCRAGQWSSKHLTEGAIPKVVALKIAPPRVWKKLQEVRLVEASADGWLIHDFLKYNPPASEVLAERARKAKNVSDFRERKKAGKTSSASDVTAPVTGHVTGYTGGLLPGSLPGCNRVPDPDPDPDPVPSEPVAAAARVPTRPVRELARTSLPGRPELVAVLAACQKLTGAVGDMDAYANGLDAFAMNSGATKQRVVDVAKCVNAMILTEDVHGSRVVGWYRKVATRLMRKGELEREIAGGEDRPERDKGSGDADVLKLGNLRF